MAGRVQGNSQPPTPNSQGDPLKQRGERRPIQLVLRLSPLCQNGLPWELGVGSWKLTPPVVLAPSSLKSHDVGLRDVVGALVVALLALTLFIATLQPDLGGPEDTPKFQFLGYVFGTAH